VFLGDDSTTKIVGRGRVRLILQDGRSRTLLGVLHIQGLERNLIYVSKMSDVGVHTLFQKDLCKMVRGDGINERSSDWNPIQVSREC
jgi:hypothetical protein